MGKPAKRPSKTVGKNMSQIQEPRPKPRRLRRNGQLVRNKYNPNGAANSTHHMTVVVKFGQGSRIVRALLKHPFRARSAIEQAWRAKCDEIVAHLGGEGEMTPTMRAYVDDYVRHGLIASIAINQALQEGLVMPDGSENPATAVYFKYSRAHREMGQALGLRRAERPVQTLNDLLAREPDPQEPDPQEPDQEPDQ
jgi:hypothetical protein